MVTHPNGSSPRPPSLLGRYALDPRSLAAFRIALGLLLLFDLASRAPDLVALYTDAGAVPRVLVHGEHPTPLPFRLFLATGSPLGSALLLGAFGVFALGLTVGRYTRLCSIACWLLWCSLMARNPYVLNFGDRILRVALFWGMLLPLGGAASLDARRSPDRPPPELGVAALAYQIQLVIIYAVGALHKNHPIWTSGQAVSYVLQFDQLTRPLGHALSAYPKLMEWLTHATLLFEAVVVPLVLSPFKTAFFRATAIAGAVAFHAGLGLTLFLGHFPAVCIAAWLPLLPGFVWDRLGAAIPAPPLRLRTTPGSTLAAAALAVVILYNAATLRSGHEVPEPLAALARITALDQRWTMFAPHPSRIDGWFVVSGHRSDGSFVDAWSGEGTPRYAKPADPRLRYAHHRWMSYMVKMHVDRERSEQSRYLAAYLCRRWNDAHPDAPIDHLAIDFMQELTLPGGIEDQPIAVPIVRHRCGVRGDANPPA